MLERRMQEALREAVERRIRDGWAVAGRNPLRLERAGSAVEVVNGIIREAA